MSLFSREKSYLGVDIGTSSIKIVELVNQNGKPRLFTYGYIDWPTNIIKSNASEIREKIVYLIQSICGKSKTRSKKAVTALPSFSTFNSIINLPKMSKKNLAAAVLWEAKKFVPIPIEEVILDWKLIDEVESGPLEPSALTFNNPQGESLPGASESDPGTVDEANSGVVNDIAKEADSKLKAKKEEHKKDSQSNIRVLLTAAPRSLVKKYIEIFKLSGLNLLSLEIESFALGRSLIGRDMAPVMVIDFGAIATDIIIIKDGIPLLTRSIDIGGVTITKSIVNALNIDDKRAEQFKCDIGVSGLMPARDLSGTQESVFAFSGTTKGQGGLPRAIREVVNPLVNEVRYSLDLFQGQSNLRVERIVLSGGSAFLPDLPQFFSQALEIKTYIGDPWERVAYPVELKFTLEELGPRFALAVGLAMREIV